MAHSSKQISIVGGGLAGSLMAIFLRERGYPVRVFEYRADPEKREASSGRSINLAISTRGFTALRRVGLEKQIRQRCIPMYGRRIHNLDGGTEFHSYGKHYQHINSVSRGQLNEKLVEAGKGKGVEFEFDHKCIDFDPDSSKAVFRTRDGTEVTREADLWIGADGAFSKVRESLMKSGRFDYAQSFLDHGYKELTIGSTDDGRHALKPDALHIWPRDNFMLIALPNLDRSFTCTLFLPFEGPISFESLDGEPHKVAAFFERHFPSAVPLIDNLEAEYESNPTGSLVTVRCFPYHRGDRVLLIGDAAHAVVPFYGQGMNAAFEDCRIIDDLLDKWDDDWSRVLPGFSRTRKPDADAIADLARYNYREMRALVKKPGFRARQAVNQWLQTVFPEKWKSLYSMVTFSNTPYAEAKKQGQSRNEMLDRMLPVATLNRVFAD